MYLVPLFAVALLGCCRCANVNKHMKLLSEIDNSIETNLQRKAEDTHQIFSIVQRPNASYAHVPGTTIELTCEAVGGPAPSIHWFKNDAPVYEYDIEANELIDRNPTSLGRISSTLLVTKTVSADVYTCLATTGVKTGRATTLVYSTDGSTELSERIKLYPLKPRIVVSYKSYFDVIGNNIVLPCRVKGHPRPHITWLDSKGVNVKKDPRMKVLRSGELVISSLRWPDMGEFTCRATNVFGSQLAKTFVYPAKAG